MNQFKILSTILAALCTLLLVACDEDDMTDDPTNCTDVATVVDINTRGACDETLAFNPEVSMTTSGGMRTITSNAIPDHKVGLFGQGQGSLNPNAISPQNDAHSFTTSPTKSGSVTNVLSTISGPSMAFGILLNGVLLDPEAAEPWPHDGIMSMSTKNWEWNLDAMSINLGLDCNNAHVQPTGKYHYHGAPTLYFESLNATSNEMTLVGYAADGFPIYYNYAYATANDANSSIVSMTSSYRLRSGDRAGDGDSAPCGSFSGIYTNDYKYVQGLGDLDECNGRTGVTPEYPAGTYYYMITITDYPYVSRCLMGTPSDDFKFH